MRQAIAALHFRCGTPHNTIRMKILFVENEKKAAAYLRKGLAENGFVADLAVDGEGWPRTWPLRRMIWSSRRYVARPCRVVGARVRSILRRGPVRQPEMLSGPTWRLRVPPRRARGAASSISRPRISASWRCWHAARARCCRAATAKQVYLVSNRTNHDPPSLGA